MDIFNKVEERVIVVIKKEDIERRVIKNKTR